ncbi:MAG TPA: family 78 glycoside hydrolase catalytic domain [Opitutaceae bacterium]|nr:family 78 glycoside hydrolase catalytic domain [Opitutaceae bacterium]
MSTLEIKRMVAVSALLMSALISPDANAKPAYALTAGEGAAESLGYASEVPTFSWKLPESVKRQTAFQIEVRQENKTLWDSGWINSDQSTFVRFGGAPLTSRQHVQWRVRFRDENGHEQAWSPFAQLETGLLSAKDWKAQWIRPSQTAEAAEPVGYLRRQFTADKEISRARLYVTARGIFEMEINGQRVGSDHFANGFTVYDKRLDTLTYDVTKLLKRGENSVQGKLGTGWYAGRYPFGTKQIGPYGKDTGLLVQLEITYADGSSQTVASDGQWEGTYVGPIVSSSLYDGEIYDARRQSKDWAPVTATHELGEARLTPKPFAPVRETQTVTPVKISVTQSGGYIFDLGQNLVGWARVKIPVEANQSVTLRFAEMLKDDGTLYTENYRSAKSTDVYTAATSGEIVWEPRFTFHGFRYVELSGLPKNAKPQNDWVTGIVLHSDLPTIGSFDSSHAKLNQLQSNIVWGWRGNSLDIPTDCPQRDERAGWTGDAEVFCATALYNTDSHAFWKSWLGSLRDDQDADGGIPDFVPSAKHKGRAHSPGWMDAATIIPWDVYVRTGDVEVLAENFSMMEKLVGWYRGQTVDGLLPKIKGYGDWLQPYSKPAPGEHDWAGDKRGDTPPPLLGLAFYGRSAQILADSARVLGRNDDAKKYADEAATVRANFTRQYFDANGKMQNAPETQTGYVLAIAFNLIPAELKAKAGENLARLVAEAGGHLRTGFLGTPFLTAALDETGHADVAAQLLFQDSYPSWFYPIDQGATTMWERWNSYTRDRGFGDVAMNSFNHYAYGAIGQWMYERVAGLTPDAAQPGYKHFIVRPLIVSQLEHARAELDTPYGKASSAWKKQNGKVAIDVLVPPNTTATFESPDGAPAKILEPGPHHFEVATK